ncbi:MAG: hypothetical protein ACRD5F_00940 [Candidatus Acidiferrales bacterium]
MLIRAGLRTLGLALVGVFLFGSAAEAQLNSRRGGVVMVARLQGEVGVRWNVQPAARTPVQRAGVSQVSPSQHGSQAGHLLQFNTSTRLTLGSEMRAQFRLETTDGRGELLALRADSSRAGTGPVPPTPATATVANAWSTIDPRSGRQDVAQTFLAVTKEGADSVVRMTLVAF